MSQYLGRVTLNINGTVIDSRPGASIDLGGVTTTAVVNDQGMGFCEQLKPSRIECEISLRKGTSIEQFRNLRDVTAVYICDTGQRYIVKGGRSVDSLRVTGGEGGRVPLVIEGEPAQEVVS
jgi:hypothetical protein